MDRNKTINVRITEDEDRMLKALAEHQGMSLSDVLRQYIRRAFGEAFPAKNTRRA